MTITIDGATQTPKWATTQKLIATALGIPGVLTRIRRDDNGCNYRLAGVYSLTFTPNFGDDTQVTLIVR